MSLFKWMRNIRNILDRWKSIWPKRNPEDPTRTDFAVIVSSFHKKWSCIYRLLSCASISAEKISSIIKSYMIDIGHCGLGVQVITTDNHPLNVNLWRSLGILEIKVPRHIDKHIIISSNSRSRTKFLNFNILMVEQGFAFALPS